MTSLPSKHVAAGCVFLDEDGRVLLVEPVYKQPWELPGGGVEAGESPFDACRREVAEELGLIRPPSVSSASTTGEPSKAFGAMLCDLSSSAACSRKPNTSEIRLNAELSEWRFVELDELDHPAIARRIRVFVGRPVLEEGVPADHG